MSSETSIDDRFEGLAGSANGGYVCGLVADLVGGTAEVTLRRPTPLGRPLRLERADSGAVSLYDHKTVIAEGAPAGLEIDVPEPISFSDAEAASKAGRALRQKFPDVGPTCFTCGPERAEGDGLRIFAGPVPGRELVAAPWIPHPSVADEAGLVSAEIVWAALDCPGYFAVMASPEEPAVLGRMAAKIVALPRVDEPYVVAAWPLGGEGRKLCAGTALLAHDGTLLAAARQTWIKLA